MNSEPSEADLAALGLRPIIRWVPDTRSPAFRERYQRQRVVIAQAAETQRSGVVGAAYKLMKAGCEAGADRDRSAAGRVWKTATCRDHSSQ
jgi:hypothetical protein